MTHQGPENQKDTAAQIAEMIQALTLNAQPVQSSRTRHVVEQVLGSIMAAYKSGISFEQLAVVFQQGGIAIAPTTLRRHYFEAKAKSELAKQAERSAEKIIKARKALSKSKISKIHQIQLNDLLNQPKSIASKSAAKTAMRKNQERPEARLTQQRDQIILEVETHRTPDAPLPSLVKNGITASDNSSDAHSLDQIELASIATEVRTPVTEDLLVVEGRVFTASNKPFIGTLTKKQIFVLRNTGKIVAQTMIGSTAQDFVEMRSKL